MSAVSERSNIIWRFFEQF